MSSEKLLGKDGDVPQVSDQITHLYPPLNLIARLRIMEATFLAHPRNLEVVETVFLS